MMPSSSLSVPGQGQSQGQNEERTGRRNRRGNAAHRHRSASPLVEAPLLTHHVRHHGQITLIPPDSQGRVRARSREPRLNRQAKQSKTHGAAHPLNASTSDIASTSSAPSMRTIVDYSIPSRPRLKQVPSALDTSRGPNEDYPRRPAPRPHSSASHYSTHSVALSSSTSNSLPITFQHITNNDFRPSALDEHPETPRQRGEDQPPPPELPDTPPPSFSEAIQLPVDLTASLNTTFPESNRGNLVQDSESVPPALEINATDGPDEGPSAEFHLAWERDREAGLPLEVRVRRDWERRQASGIANVGLVVSHSGIVSSPTASFPATRQTLSTTGSESRASTPPIPHSSSSPPLNVLPSDIPQPLTPQTPTLSLTPCHPPASRPLPKPPPSAGPTPLSAYVSLFPDRTDLLPATLPLPSTNSSSPNAPHAGVDTPIRTSSASSDPMYSQTKALPHPSFNTSHPASDSPSSSSIHSPRGNSRPGNESVDHDFSHHALLKSDVTEEKFPGVGHRLGKPPQRWDDSFPAVAENLSVESTVAQREQPSRKSFISDREPSQTANVASPSPKSQPTSVLSPPVSSSSDVSTVQAHSDEALFSGGSPKAKRTLASSPPSSFPSASTSRPRSPVLFPSPTSPSRNGPTASRVQNMIDGFETMNTRRRPPPPPPPPSRRVQRRPPPPPPVQRRTPADAQARPLTRNRSSLAVETESSSLANTNPDPNAEGSGASALSNADVPTSTTLLNVPSTFLAARASLIDASDPEMLRIAAPETPAVRPSGSIPSERFERRSPSPFESPFADWNAESTNVTRVGIQNADLLPSAPETSITSVPPESPPNRLYGQPTPSASHDLTLTTTPRATAADWIPLPTDAEAATLLQAPSPTETFEYTDLDLLVARLDSPAAISNLGSTYDDLLTISSIIGPAETVESNIGGGSSANQAIENLPVARVEVERRRITKDGRTKLKLSLMGVVVDRCSVCMSQFKREEMGVLLPCLHSFHPKCASTWLRQNSTCPLCRTHIADAP